MLVTTSLIPITTAQREGKRAVKPGKVDSQVWSKYDQSQVSQSSKWEGDESSTPSELFQVPLSSFKSSKRRPSQPPLAVTPNLVATVDVGLETEPNNTSATANALGGSGAKIKGNIFPNGDIDFYSFTAGLGDRVYAATMTSASASASVDSVLDLIASDGTTVLETDNDDGSFGATSSGIAGFAIPSAGTYFLRVRHNSATAQIRPYDLYFTLQSGSPTPETEPNDTFPGQALPASGWVSGSTSSATDLDFYSIALNAGDTVFLSLDLDPERDTVEWNAQLGFGAFGTPPVILVVNDGGTATPDSESFFMTVQDAGTYSVLVSLPTGGTTFGTYNLSVSVLPRVNRGINCTTYTSTNVPVTIPTGPGIATSTLTVPGSPRIESMRVKINLTHNFMSDLDVELTSPTGNTIGLFSDVGSVTAGSQTTMDTTLDDIAGIPIGLFTIVQGESFQPELNYRLDWFKGQSAAGTWTLTIRDDATADGGTLNGWSIEICEPPPAPTCGGTPTTVFTTDFESGDAGFTHSGTLDEWELGNPTFVPVTGCNSGTNCWKTDLDNTYNASSSQDLLSPNINLANLGGPIILNWAQKFQIESATFDHAFVEVREVGNPSNALKVWEWTGATMTNTVGNPTVTTQEAGGWGTYSANISAFSGLNVEVRFHLDSDTTVQLAGLAIDDVTVTACQVTGPSDGQLLISEFRVRGPNGPNDEFIEIYNNSGADHTVAAVSGTGYGVAASDGTTRCTIPNGTVIPNRGHYLCVNSVGYSLGSYPAGNGTTATGDATYTTDIPENAGIALFNNNTGGGSYSLANRIDAVGSTSEANTVYKEGTGYPALSTSSFLLIDYSFYRDDCGKGGAIPGTALCTRGVPGDSNNNAVDFIFVDTNGSSAGAGQRLGAPGPQNLSSTIQRNATIKASLLDPCVNSATAPNRVRDLTSDPPNNSTFGTIDIRRTFTNNTGGAVTRLRFRIVDQTTFPAPSGTADLRIRTSSDLVVTVDRPPCDGSTSGITVRGLTLDQPPSQPNGGAFNSSWSAGTITLATPLAAGATIDVRFFAGIQQTGNFRLFLNVEALP
jgi:subtilisin-like proprotein convertase family protein